jgi:hypothetical protein
MIGACPTKIAAFDAASNWILLGREGGHSRLWRDVTHTGVPSKRALGIGAQDWIPDFNFKLEQPKVEHYILASTSEVMGDLYVTTSPNGRDGVVRANKTPGNDTREFRWQDDGEYVRLMRIKNAKAYSAKRAAASAPSTQTRMFGQMLVTVVAVGVRRMRIVVVGRR